MILLIFTILLLLTIQYLLVFLLTINNCFDTKTEFWISCIPIISLLIGIGIIINLCRYLKFELIEVFTDIYKKLN